FGVDDGARHELFGGRQDDGFPAPLPEDRVEFRVMLDVVADAEAPLIGWPELERDHANIHAREGEVFAPVIDEVFDDSPFSAVQPGEARILDRRAWRCALSQNMWRRTCPQGDEPRCQVDVHTHADSSLLPIKNARTRRLTRLPLSWFGAAVRSRAPVLLPFR